MIEIFKFLKPVPVWRVVLRSCARLKLLKTMKAFNGIIYTILYRI